MRGESKRGYFFWQCSTAASECVPWCAHHTHPCHLLAANEYMVVDSIRKLGQARGPHYVIHKAKYRTPRRAQWSRCCAQSLSLALTLLFSSHCLARFLSLSLTTYAFCFYPSVSLAQSFISRSLIQLLSHSLVVALSLTRSLSPSIVVSLPARDHAYVVSLTLTRSLLSHSFSPLLAFSVSLCLSLSHSFSLALQRYFSDSHPSHTLSPSVSLPLLCL